MSLARSAFINVILFLVDTSIPSPNLNPSSSSEPARDVFSQSISDQSFSDEEQGPEIKDNDDNEGDDFGDDFDDFEEGDEGADFDDFEDGFQQAEPVPSPGPVAPAVAAPPAATLPFVSVLCLSVTIYSANSVRFSSPFRILRD